MSRVYNTRRMSVSNLHVYTLHRMCAESHALGMLIISVYVLDYVRILLHVWKRSLIYLHFKCDSPHTFNATYRQVRYSAIQVHLFLYGKSIIQSVLYWRFHIHISVSVYTPQLSFIGGSTVHISVSACPAQLT